MDFRKPCTAANVLVSAAALAWVTYVLLAVWSVQGSARPVALGVAGALTVISLAVNSRQIASIGVRHVTVAVAAAPREAYYRGYGDAAHDAFGPGADDQGDTVDLRSL